MENIDAKKSLGQNFLINEGIIEKIIISADLTAEDTVLEVGPGTGNLTRALVATGARVIAVEKDHRAIEDLQAEFSAPQIEIIEKDILEFKPEDYGLTEGNYKIVANLPYYITSHFIRNVFEEWPQPTSIVIMVQKEVAKRIMSKPPEMNLLALSVKYYAEPEIVTYVSRGSFRPMPTVDSAVIKLTPRTEYALPVEKEALFFAILKSAFAEKRKQLINTLPTIIGMNKQGTTELLKQIGLSPQTRPETVSMEYWLILVNSL
ncbi:MAG: 16S rRNA (adenine(1518)-N(6)/adenine(1519)-N(6))-dimethyltransferase RsmA [Patescibacteria group bacterium]